MLPQCNSVQCFLLYCLEFLFCFWKWHEMTRGNVFVKGGDIVKGIGWGKWLLLSWLWLGREPECRKRTRRTLSETTEVLCRTFSLLWDSLPAILNPVQSFLCRIELDNGAHFVGLHLAAAHWNRPLLCALRLFAPVQQRPEDKSSFQGMAASSSSTKSAPPAWLLPGLLPCEVSSSPAKSNPTKSAPALPSLVLQCD